MVNLQGFYVRGYTDPLEAIEYIKENHNMISAMISDGIMPSMSGIQMVQTICEWETSNDLPKLPSFICYGNCDEEYVQQCLENGVSAVIPKPFSSQYLEKALKEHIAN